MRCCARRGCTTKTRQGFIMCRDCWSQVPKKVRDLVWRASRGGTRQEKLTAVRLAIESLPAKEEATP